MGDDIISICNSKCIWHYIAIVRCKDCIANTRLSKCHNLDILVIVANLHWIANPQHKASIKQENLN